MVQETIIHSYIESCQGYGSSFNPTRLSAVGFKSMDPETGFGLPSTGKKARLLIGGIVAAAVRALACSNLHP